MSQPDLTLLWLRASLRYSVHLDTRSFSNKNESKYVVPTWASPFLTSPWSFLTLKCLPQIQIRILRLIIKEDICDAHPSWSGRRPYPRRLKRKLALTNLPSTNRAPRLTNVTLAMGPPTPIATMAEWIPQQPYSFTIASLTRRAHMR